MHDRGSIGFPARIKPANGPRDLFSQRDASAATTPAANLAPSSWEAFKRAWRLRGTLEGDAAKLLVRQLFSFALAVAHAPQFETDHGSALAQDWLHLPIPKDRTLFAALVQLGEKVSRLLDPGANATQVLRDLLGSAAPTLAVVASRETDQVRESDLVVTVSYYGAARGGWEERSPTAGEAADPAMGDTTGDLRLNDTIYLKNVPAHVWRYELGGYPVIKKWLGYRDHRHRPGRGLTLAEIDHLRGMVHRLAALHLLHARLDAAYTQAIADSFRADDLGLAP